MVAGLEPGPLGQVDVLLVVGQRGADAVGTADVGAHHQRRERAPRAPRSSAVPTTTVTPVRRTCSTHRVEPRPGEVGGPGQGAGEDGGVVPGQERLGQHQHPHALVAGERGQARGGAHVGVEVARRGRGLAGGDAQGGGRALIPVVTVLVTGGCYSTTTSTRWNSLQSV